MITITVDGDRAELHGSTKGDPVEAAIILRPWVWSRGAGAWVLPRSLRPLTRDMRIEQTARAFKTAGIECEVTDDGSISEGERRDSRAQRLETRADRHEATAERKAGERDAAWDRSRQISDGIPMGQPILVGHHSERRHRKDIERMNRLDSRGLEAHKVAEESARKGENLRRALERGESPVTVKRRIDRQGAEIRALDRRLAEHALAVKIARTSLADLTGLRPMSAAWLDRTERERALLAEAIELDHALIAELEARGATKVWGKADFKVGDHVQNGRRWHKVARVNAKSVSVETGYSWTDTIRYSDVTGQRSPDASQAAG